MPLALPSQDTPPFHQDCLKNISSFEEEKNTKCAKQTRPSPIGLLHLPTLFFIEIVDLFLQIEEERRDFLQRLSSWL